MGLESLMRGRKSDPFLTLKGYSNPFAPLALFGGCEPEQEEKPPPARDAAPTITSVSCVPAKEKTPEEVEAFNRGQEVEDRIRMECVGSDLLSTFSPPEKTIYYPVIFKFLVTGTNPDTTALRRTAAKTLQTLNQAFAPANIQFFQKDFLVQENSCGIMFDFDHPEDHFVEGGLVVLIQSARVPANGRTVLGGGFAVFGNLEKELPIAAHEMGHVFGLLHTHGEPYSSNPDPNVEDPSEEWVDGSNAEEKGDRIADTPADPGPAKEGKVLKNPNGCFVNDQCQIESCGKDAKGEEYLPDIRNYMSYYRGNCRTHFSRQQIQKILCVHSRSPALNKILQGK